MECGALFLRVIFWIYFSNYPKNNNWDIPNWGLLPSQIVYMYFKFFKFILKLLKIIWRYFKLKLYQEGNFKNPKGPIDIPKIHLEKIGGQFFMLWAYIYIYNLFLKFEIISIWDLCVHIVWMYFGLFYILFLKLWKFEIFKNWCSWTQIMCIYI